MSAIPHLREYGDGGPWIVALHGGSGHGRSFLWSWVREARSRRCLLVAPTSLGATWSFQGTDLDAPIVHAPSDNSRYSTTLNAIFAVAADRLRLRTMTDTR